MEFRSLGKTGLKVTNLCVGTMTFGNQADKQTSFEILDKAFDAGVNFIDTADVYPIGRQSVDIALHFLSVLPGFQNHVKPLGFDSP